MVLMQTGFDLTSPYGAPTELIDVTSFSHQYISAAVTTRGFSHAG